MLAPHAVDLDGFLDTVRVTGEPGYHECDDEDDESGCLDEAELWATAHRIEIAEDPGYVVRCDDGSFAVVITDDPTCPHESWGEPILAFAWNSEHYAAVGNRGYGEEGVYEVRPGLVAWVTITDEGVQEITFRRVPRRNRWPRLALEFLTDRQLGQKFLGVYAPHFAEDKIDKALPGNSWRSSMSQARLDVLLRELV